MKFHRIASGALIAGLAVLACFPIWRGLTSGGGGFGRSASYGNLWISYSWQERGILDDKVNWLIAAPNQIRAQGYSGGEDECYITFKTGKTFSFSADSEKLIWVDPIDGPRAVAVDSSRDFIEDLERSSEHAKQQVFESAVELIEAVKTN